MAHKLSEQSITVSPSHSLRLCYHLIYLLIVTNARTAGLERCREFWSRINSTVLSPLLAARENYDRESQDYLEAQVTHTQSVARLAYACLKLIECEYGKSLWYGNWVREFQTHDTIFSDDFTKTLIKLTSTKDRWALWHLRELREKRATNEWSIRQGLRTWESHYNWSDCGDSSLEEKSGHNSESMSRSPESEDSPRDAHVPTTRSHTDKAEFSEASLLDAREIKMNEERIPSRHHSGRKPNTATEEEDDGPMGNDEG